MLRKIVLGVAATVGVFGLAALAPTSASAHGGFYRVGYHHWFYHHFWRPSYYGAYDYDSSCYYVRKPWGLVKVCTNYE
jgi:hypothetical protein